ncbi:hypothetical protein MTR67_046383, partial [Solanum verrucosum]
RDSFLISLKQKNQIFCDQLNSFTIITVEKESQYPGYLEDFYENKKGQKRVEVWCSEHFQGVHCVIPKLEDHLEKYLSRLMFRSMGHMLHEVKDITREVPLTQGLKGSRSVSESDHSSIRKPIPGNQIAKAEPPTCLNLKIKFPSVGSVGIQYAAF